MPINPQDFQRLRDARRHRLARQAQATSLACWLKQSIQTCLRAGRLCFKHTDPRAPQQVATYLAPDGQYRHSGGFVGGSSRLTPDKGPGVWMDQQVKANHDRAQGLSQGMSDLQVMDSCMRTGIPVLTEDGIQIPIANLRNALFVAMTDGFEEEIHASLSKVLRKVYPWFDAEEVLRKKLWRGSGRAMGYSHKANKAQQAELRKANKAGQGSRLFQAHVTQYWDNAWIDVARFFQSTRFFNNPQHCDRIEKMLLSMASAGEALTEGSMIDSVWRPMHGAKNRQTLPLGLVARRWLVEVRGIDPHRFKDARPPAHVSTIIPETAEQKFERLLAYASKNPDSITDEEWAHLERLALLAGA